MKPENEIPVARAGDDIVVSKWIALEGTSLIAKKRREELLGRLPGFLVDEAAGFDRYLSVDSEKETASRYRVSAMREVKQGGIFGALWDMAEEAGLGLKADLRLIPIRQETIEVCNFFDINPYRLISGGCLLMASKEGWPLAGALRECGMGAAVIGSFTEGNDRLIINKGHIRYLERSGRGGTDTELYI